MIDASAAEAVVDLGRERSALPEQQTGEQRGRRRRQGVFDGGDRSAPHPLMPGRRGRVECHHLIRSRGTDDVDAISSEPRDVVEAAGILKPDRCGQACIGADPLARHEREVVAVRRELKPSAARLVVDTLHLEEEARTSAGRDRRRDEAADDIRSHRERQPRDVVAGKWWRRGTQDTERSHGHEHRDGAEHEATCEHRDDADHDAGTPHRPGKRCRRPRRERDPHAQRHGERHQRQ